MEKKVKLTVITVVYNGELTIEKTIQSLLDQTYSDKEFIIINGLSTDKTDDIIQKYIHKIDKYINETDKGLYDAMNKAIKISSGEYINFMNAGDTFYNPYVLERVFGYTRTEDVIFGKRISVFKETSNEQIPQDIKTLWKGMTFCHQASFVKSDLYKKFYFDLEYKVSSVYDFFFKCYKSNASFKYINEPIVFYDMNGISATSFLWFKDYINIAKKYEPNKRLNIVVRAILLLIKRILDRPR